MRDELLCRRHESEVSSPNCNGRKRHQSTTEQSRATPVKKQELTDELFGKLETLLKMANYELNVDAYRGIYDDKSDNLCYRCCLRQLDFDRENNGEFINGSDKGTTEKEIYGNG